MNEGDPEVKQENEEIYSFQKDVVDKDHHFIFNVVLYKSSSLLKDDETKWRMEEQSEQRRKK